MQSFTIYILTRHLNKQKSAVQTKKNILMDRIGLWTYHFSRVLVCSGQFNHLESRAAAQTLQVSYSSGKVLNAIKASKVSPQDPSSVSMKLWH